MWSTIAALKGVLRVRQSETKWRLFGFLKRVSTSEHGIAGHDRLALSVRSWSSCSIAACGASSLIRNHGSTKHIDDAGTPAPARARRARLGIAAEWRFWQVFGRCELRAVRQRTKSPSPRCSDQVINRKPWKQTQRPSETSPPRSPFIAPGSLRRICGWQRASGGALSLLSTE